jgi:mRNA-degrading endonuclease RelE of RelBE toxin-antitoxin system
MTYRLEFRESAERRLIQIARRNPQIAKGIHGKIIWLVDNVDAIGHERLKGHEGYSLHFGQYRILYTLDRARHLITIEDIGRHDEVYRRLERG